jgi:uncharacterized protein
MEDEKIASFREKLDNHHNWPSLYTFKFIAPKSKEGEVRALFRMHEVVVRPSSKGNYVSLTIQMMASSSDDVINKYKEVYLLEGIISL